MNDVHHHVKQQHLRDRFPRGAVEVPDLRSSSVLDTVLVPAEKPPNPAHVGLRHISQAQLLADPRNHSKIEHYEHMKENSTVGAQELYRFEIPPEAWEFARWVGLDYKLEGRDA